MANRSKTLSRQARAAADLKHWLRRAFPGVKFSVRSKSFAGGTSLRVSWHFGPTQAAVEEWATDYRDGIFDPSQDLYIYDCTPEGRGFREKRGGAKHVHCHRSYAPSGGDWHDEERLFERVARDLCALQRIEYRSMSQCGLLGAFDTLPLRTHVHQLFARATFEPGKDYGGVEYTPSDEYDDPRGWCRVVLVDAGNGIAL